MRASERFPEPVAAAMDAGYSIVPFKGDHGAVRWGRWHTQPQTAAEQGDLPVGSTYAILTGQAHGIVVLDFDNKNGRGGLETHERLGLPVHVRTKSGGVHVYVKHPGFPVLKAAYRDQGKYPGLDVQGEGGVAFFYGRTPSGQYQPLVWPPEPIDPSPEVLQLLQDMEKRPRTGSAPPGTWEGDGYGTRAAVRELLRGAARLRDAEPGTSNDVLCQVAYNAGGLVAAGVLDGQYALETLLGAAEDRNVENAGQRIQLEMGAGAEAPRVPTRTQGAMVRASDVEPEDVEWLWHHRIPLGKVTIVAGDPGGGKTFLGLKLCAAVTGMQHLPGNEWAEKGSAVYMSFEDSAGDTLRPRAEAMGADLDRLFFIGPEHAMNTGQLDDLEDLLDTIGDLRLLVIDPVGSLVGGRVDTARDNEVREALTPLVKMAERRGIAVVVVAHLRKSEGRASTSVNGSIGFVGLVRTVLVVGDVDGTKAVATAKNNLAPFAPTLTFDLVQEEGQRQAALHWTGEIEADADAVVGRELKTRARRASPERDRARAFLMRELKSGSRPAKELQELADQDGIGGKVLKQAKAELGVESHKDGLRAGWVWTWDGEEWEEVA